MARILDRTLWELMVVLSLCSSTLWCLASTGQPWMSVLKKGPKRLFRGFVGDEISLLSYVGIIMKKL